MRSFAAFFVVLTICLTGGETRPEAQTPRRATPAGIPAEALLKARSSGLVRVIVSLDVTFTSESLLGADAGGVPAHLHRKRASQAPRPAREAEFSRVRRFVYIPYVALEIDEATLQALAAAPEVRRIDVDELLKPTLAQSSTLIGAPAAWNAGYTGAGWSIAVLDTGVDKTHPFLAGKVVSEACYSTTVAGFSTSVCPGGAASSTDPGSGMPCAMSDCAHGTHVAGIAAGNGGGFSGIAKDASIVAIQVFSSIASDCDGEPTPCARAFESDLMAGLERVYALRQTHSFAAVNMSVGGGVFSAPCDGNPSKAIIDQLRDAGIATVVSSGNDGSVSGISSPACISSAISVGLDDRRELRDGGRSGLELHEQQSIPDVARAGADHHVLSARERLRELQRDVDGRPSRVRRLGGAEVAQPIRISDGRHAGVDVHWRWCRRFRQRVDEAANSDCDAAVGALQGPCSYTVTPTRVNLPRRGGTLTLTVTTGNGCPWSTSTNAGFVSISGSTGHGSVSLTLSIDANPLLTRRAAVAMFAGTAVTIDQAGVAAGDVDADGFGDLIWQHMTNGSIATWYLEAKNVIATSRLSIDRVADVNWRIVGSGDLNGDGYADVVWQHETTGQLAVWYLSGTQVVATLPLSIDRVEDTNWKIRAVGDANGDGFADLFWQHTTQGWLAVWFMRGAEAIATESMSPARVPDISWRVAGAGDIDGDRKADLLWQNDGDGRVAAWLMDGTRAVGQRVLSIPSVTEPNWKLSGVSDASGDGYADALWQNMVTGELAVWYLTGFEVIGTHRLSHGVGSGSQWHLVGPG